MGKILSTNQIKYLSKFIYKSDPLVKEMEEFASLNSIPILLKDSAAFLEQMILISKPRRVLELGTAIAYSSIRIASFLSGKGVLHTIEKSKNNIKIAEKNIERSGLSGKIKLIEGDALDIMPSLDKKYDFIFLDADKKDYVTLFNYSLVLLKKNGIIFIDNLLWHGYAGSHNVPEEYKASTALIREFNNIFMSNTALISTILPIGDGIGIGVKIK